MGRRALIIGLGIGGMSAAIALKRQGWTPIIVERAAGRRKGGYFIGLRDEGKNAAAALGVLAVMSKRTPSRARFWDIRRNGNRKPMVDLTNETNAPIALLRGDIEEALWQGIEGQIEVRFGTVPVAVTQTGEQVRVRLRHGAQEHALTQHDDGQDRDVQEVDEAYDLVIGADGVRSTVRKMVFGPDQEFCHPLGTMLCAFPLSHPLPSVDAGDGILMADTGRSLTVFPLADRPATALFSYRTRNVEAQFSKTPQETLTRVFAGLDSTGIVASALRDLANSRDYLFDAVQMVKMPRWSKGRVVLLGDAAWCLTLYSGMGASAGMMGGQALGEALAAYADNIDAALVDYEKSLRPFVRRHQRFIALRSQLFVPSSWFYLVTRRLLWLVLLRTRRHG